MAPMSTRDAGPRPARHAAAARRSRAARPWPRWPRPAPRCCHRVAGSRPGRRRSPPIRLASCTLRLSLSLARHQPSLVDTWLGPAAWGDGPREPVAAIQARIADARAGDGGMASPADDAETRRAVATSPDSCTPWRSAAGRLAGVERLVRRRSRRSAWACVRRHATSRRWTRMRQELSERLPGARHRWPSGTRRSADAQAVPAARVEAVFAAAVAGAARRRVRLLPLPAGEQVTLRAADERGWAAFSRPHDARSSDLWVSRGGGADAAQLLQLAAHEGTPGHHAQHVLAMAALVEARGWAERALTPAFGPHRLLAEGAAEAGAELLLPLDAARTRVRRAAAAGGRPAAGASRRCWCASNGWSPPSTSRWRHLAADYLDTLARHRSGHGATARRGAGARSAGHAVVRREAAVARPRLSAGAPLGRCTRWRRPTRRSLGARLPRSPCCSTPIRHPRR